MSLTLYLHPLSSFCHKPLIALYENAIAFEPHVVNLGDAGERAAFQKVWRLAKFPVLRDSARSRTIPESTTIIEYLDQQYPGPVKLIPSDPAQALQVRAADRFYDMHIHLPLQKVVGDLLRPADGHDPIGVGQSWDQIKTALSIANEQLANQQWAGADEFSMADCAAGPPLFFINIMMPLGHEFPAVSAYFERLKSRPSYARVLQEAQPYLAMFPGNP
jgi:glutathione S-transferase